MGAGKDEGFNYSPRTTSRSCARAFTGWNVQLPPTRHSHHGRSPWKSSGSIRPTTTTAMRRPSWARPGTGTGMTSWTSSARTRQQPGSSPATCTTSSSPTKPQVPAWRLDPAARPLVAIEDPWRRPTSIPAMTSPSHAARLCSVPTSFKDGIGPVSAKVKSPAEVVVRDLLRLVGRAQGNEAGPLPALPGAQVHGPWT